MLIADQKLDVADDCSWLNVYFDNLPCTFWRFFEFVSWKKIDDLEEDKLTFDHNLAVLKP